MPSNKKEYNEQWRKEHKEQWNKLIYKAIKKYQKRIKNDIFLLLGNKCAICGFSDPRAFQIDHINDNGCKERKKIGRGIYYLHILKEIKAGSKDYQLLCANCNAIKEAERKSSTENNHEITNI